MNKGGVLGKTAKHFKNHRSSTSSMFGWRVPCLRRDWINFIWLKNLLLERIMHLLYATLKIELYDCTIDIVRIKLHWPKKVKSMSHVNILETDKNILTDIVIVRLCGLWPVEAPRSQLNNYSQFLIVQDDKRIFFLGCKNANPELVLYVLCFKLKYSEHFSYNWDPFVTPFITS